MIDDGAAALRPLVEFVICVRARSAHAHSPPRYNGIFVPEQNDRCSPMNRTKCPTMSDQRLARGNRARPRLARDTISVEFTFVLAFARSFEYHLLHRVHFWAIVGGAADTRMGSRQLSIKMRSHWWAFVATATARVHD